MAVHLDYIPDLKSLNSAIHALNCEQSKSAHYYLSFFFSSNLHAKEIGDDILKRFSKLNNSKEKNFEYTYQKASNYTKAQTLEAYLKSYLKHLLNQIALDFRCGDHSQAQKTLGKLCIYAESISVVKTLKEQIIAVESVEQKISILEAHAKSLSSSQSPPTDCHSLRFRKQEFSALMTLWVRATRDLFEKSECQQFQHFDRLCEYLAHLPNTENLERKVYKEYWYQFGYKFEKNGVSLEHIRDMPRNTHACRIILLIFIQLIIRREFKRFAKESSVNAQKDLKILFYFSTVEDIAKMRDLYEKNISKYSETQNTIKACLRTIKAEKFSKLEIWERRAEDYYARKGPFVPYFIRDIDSENNMLSFFYVCATAFKQSPMLGFGENHVDPSSKLTLFNMLDFFVDCLGVTTFFWEQFREDSQEDLDRHHKVGYCSLALKTILKEADRHGFDYPCSYQGLFDKAAKKQLRIVGIDSNTTPYFEGKMRWKLMHHRAAKIIKREKGPGNAIILMGKNHLNSHEEIPGICELAHCPSISFVQDPLISLRDFVVANYKQLGMVHNFAFVNAAPYYIYPQKLPE